MSTQLSSEHLSEIASTMLMLCATRGAERSVCPSEVARLLVKKEAAWRGLMPSVRHVAADLARRGIIDVTQGGRAVDIATAKGPVRLRVKTATV